MPDVGFFNNRQIHALWRPIALSLNLQGDPGIFSLLLHPSCPLPPPRIASLKSPGSISRLASIRPIARQ